MPTMSGDAHRARRAAPAAATIRAKGVDMTTRPPSKPADESDWAESLRTRHFGVAAALVLAATLGLGFVLGRATRLAMPHDPAADCAALIEDTSDLDARLANITYEVGV